MYNSMYGGGYGSMGSSYGSYGSYGSSGSPYGASSMLGTMRNQQNPQQNNNQNPPEPDERKKVFEQYFKMMGGMRSILQLGFAGVAFVNFGSRSWDLIKKIFLFLFKTSSSFLSFLAKYIPIEQVKNIVAKSTGSNGSLKWQNLIISLVRVAIIAVIFISYKLKTSIKDQVLSQHEELSKKAQQIEKKKEIINKNMQKYKEQSNL